MKGLPVHESDFDAMRRAMVASQLRTSAVNDTRVLAAMGAVPRERFLPVESAGVAYADMTLPLGGGREINLPMTTGLLLTETAPGAAESVLVVGAGTGYAAALASRLAARVVALESDPALVAKARETLADYPNVEVVVGPLEAGWAAGAPYDAIVIDGAGEHVPEALADQLAEGGRLAGGVIERGVSRLVSGRKLGGAFGVSAFIEAEAVPLPGFARPKEFVF